MARGDMLEEKIRICEEQLRSLTECRNRLSVMITFQKKLNERIVPKFRRTMNLENYAT